MRFVTGFEAARKLLVRRVNASVSDAAVEQSVRSVIEEVVRDGDAGLKLLTAKFDRVELLTFEVSRENIEAARSAIDPELLAALETAAGRIRSYHLDQRKAISAMETAMNGRQMFRALERVGIYAPGGKAYYPSTVLMTAIPAKAAGVPEVILTTPPGPDGKIPAPTLAAAAIAGVDRVFRVGGAQAIAALAYGTESVPKVDKICGPGNIYVMTAKRLVYGAVAIDGLQGPSEVLIIADESANLAFVASDMLAQAEHDPLAQSVLVTTSKIVAEKVLTIIQNELASSARRDITGKSLEERGIIALVDKVDQAIELANAYAPEHLLVLTADAEMILKKIENAGCAFVGDKASVAFGDYVAGPSHALPTGGTARFASPLNVLDFLKITDVVHVDDSMVKSLGPDAATIAGAEGLTAHRDALRLRMEAK
ncbi:histidinol dehydrogenase [Dehalogenimonas etheniformans]|uniref:Histidinol dehydrogenase n=1 Tax=Dehalogenimonas etheniformans TaxID=1536648 RepID=A0A2P5P662_9CHLR|nr:histidinol dehydrogenase [Dehalogenimonas etheniformans]PPD57786.1 histidinol dehydrogenase [Dehalogenimonas etheniformans]QNT76128.1 histidinol dehydrogenase [Dehalogenimonas etheniformans]